MAILTLFLRQILFSAASVTCLPYLSWGLPLCFCPMVMYVSICVRVYLWLSHFPSLWIGIQEFCYHCVFLLTNVAVCRRPWVICLYILSLKEVICTLMCQCQEKSVWFGVIRIWGMLLLFFFFPWRSASGRNIKGPKKSNQNEFLQKKLHTVLQTF